MIKIAVLLTVYNRKDVTLRGLSSLYRAIETLGKDHSFDIYMTDDGCTDGTGEAVAKEFPTVHIIRGNGNLYWSGGMCKAWQVAIASGNEYDYFLWFNDDAELYDNALQTMFLCMQKSGGNSIISGAFCDNDGKVSYGGRNKEMVIISPCGKLQDIFLMNGNLTLIPEIIVKTIGIIDKTFTHSMGDWDYGLRAIKSGFHLYLSTKYVGMTERHDAVLAPFMSNKYSLFERLRSLYSAKYSVFIYYKFRLRHFGIIQAIKIVLLHHLYALFPCLKEYRDKRR